MNLVQILLLLLQLFHLQLYWSQSCLMLWLHLPCLQKGFLSLLIFLGGQLLGHKDAESWLYFELEPTGALPWSLMSGFKPGACDITKEQVPLSMCGLSFPDWFHSWFLSSAAFLSTNRKEYVQDRGKCTLLILFTSSTLCLMCKAAALTFSFSSLSSCFSCSRISRSLASCSSLDLSSLALIFRSACS